MIRKIIFYSIVLVIASCGSTSDIFKTADEILTGSGGTPTNTEVIGGLKEALSRGVTIGSDIVSKPDGYFKNNAIKILFPPEAVKAENTLRDLGLGSLCDEAILKFNRAAEEAAKEAKPIFVGAVKQMTIQDGMNILLGPDDAATQFLKRTTSTKLYGSFKPVVDKSLGKVGANKIWTDVSVRYNKVPFVKNKLPTDVSDFVTNEAMDGIFFMIQKEEAKIRKDPLARVSGLLKKVFGYADTKK